MTDHGKTVKVGPKGQVVIPKEIRERLGIQPGNRVRVGESNGEVRVRRTPSVEQLRGLLGDGASTSDLERERRSERQREDGRATKGGS